MEEIQSGADTPHSKGPRMTHNDKYLEIWKLQKAYPTPNGSPAVIVEDFTLNVAEGEFVSVIGHSGCGKSTVLSMIAGLSQPTGGGIVLAGREIVDAGPDRGVVFQAPCLLPWMTALQNVTLGVEQVAPGKSRAEQREVAAHYLELVGLGDSLDVHPNQLSGGMRQRVGIARAFALSPKMLLLDEPFGMLDSLTRLELQQVLIDLWASDRKTALMITHDVDEALFLSDRIVMMTNGPAARVGEILEVTLPRPRDRQTVFEHPDYEQLRGRLMSFLEERANHPPLPAQPSGHEHHLPTMTAAAVNSSKSLRRSLSRSFLRLSGFSNRVT
ncbi:MAG: ABC transporter ATP-binding protein [Planctomycetia bacterium]|nr:ABC transporter ATP-binding protein [Planctomycetia bacterium]